MKPALPSPDMMHLLRLAQSAAREIMLVYASDFAVATKADLSPVTEADAMAEKVILKGLKTLAPNVPVIAEEAASAGSMPAIGKVFFLVDPLDGTKEFTTRNGEFTVNIARIESGKPTIGVVYAPATRLMFWGEMGKGAAFAEAGIEDAVAGLSWRAIKTRPTPKDGVTVLASRSHLDTDTKAFLETLNVKTLISAGSSLKFCRIAMGEADLYPRFGRTMEWDTAAGQAVLEAAGGKVCTIDGAPLAYGKADRGYANPAFIARGS
jgi:3'(2'), 5'-bisphosphate nucleotidase